MDQRYSEVPKGTTVEGAEVDADAAWAQLVSDGDMVLRLAGESKYEHLVRDMELTKQRWRKLGLAFWHDYPDDPRRYKWLMRAVHLEPRYPLDISEWAAKEARPSSNDAAINAVARRPWEEAYPGMREEFWNDPETTEVERRFLWYGELRTRLTGVAEATARGESVNGETLLVDLVAFTKRFPEPTSPAEARTHTARISGLWNAIVHFSDGLDLDPEQIRIQAKLLRETGTEVADRVDGTISSSLQQKKSGRGHPTEQRVREETIAAWNRLDDPFRGDYPSPSYIGYYVYFHEKIAAERRHLELGRYLWKNKPEPEHMRNWYARALNQIPWQVFPRRVAEAAALFAESFAAESESVREASRYALESGAVLDMDAVATFRSWRSGVSNGWLRRPSVSGQYNLWDAQLVCRNTGDNALIKNALSELLVFHIPEIPEGGWEDTEFRDWYFIDRTLRSTVRGVRDRPEDYCLSGEEVTDFFLQVSKLEDERLTAIIEGSLAVQALRSTPFEFTSPTWAGESFNLSSLRGSVVLVQFWSTSCASCISAMPRIKEVHAEYRDRGFEVVSVNFDPESNRRKVERIQDELGLDWPILQAYAQWPDLNRKFGWGNAISQYMLLDRYGLLVAYTPEIKKDKQALRAVLDEALAAEVLENETKPPRALQQISAALIRCPDTDSRHQ